jgi:hypothetical protein
LQLPLHICPVSMTYAVVPALQHQPEVAAVWEPMICSTTYDPANVPIAQKAGVTCGMALTEKQGGSDVTGSTEGTLGYLDLDPCRQRCRRRRPRAVLIASRPCSALARAATRSSLCSALCPASLPGQSDCLSRPTRLISRSELNR